MTLTQFLEKIEYEDIKWFSKRLSSNDTGLTGSHQVGIYPPKNFIRAVYPGLMDSNTYNPCEVIEKVVFPNFDWVSTNVKLTYYNNKLFPERGHKKKYDECRLTGWGGKSCPLQDPDNTGAIAIFAMNEGSAYCWIAENSEQEDLIEDWFGESLDPGKFKSNVTPNHTQKLDIPIQWCEEFPSGIEIFQYIASLKHLTDFKNVDRLLMARRKLEFSLFEKIEAYHVLPLIKKSFDSVDDFIQLAHKITNRRKSRSGRSLELNLTSIFQELKIPFSSQVITENNKKPDFIFPSGESYHNTAFSEKNLKMLAVKTTCKDRWRQILNEADRISIKHLFTLQEGVSERQLQEMEANKVVLVVPETLIEKYPSAYRSKILKLNQFCDEVLKIGTNSPY